MKIYDFYNELKQFVKIEIWTLHGVAMYYRRALQSEGLIILKPESSFLLSHDFTTQIGTTVLLLWLHDCITQSEWWYKIQIYLYITLVNLVGLIKLNEQES